VDTGVALGVLGELELRVDGGQVPVGHARQRSVLAVLAVEANGVVSVDSLIDRVWGNTAPVRVRSALWSYLSHLRRVIDSAGATITRRGSGYALTIDRDAVDVHRFRRLVAQARTDQDSEHALTLVEDALGLWRGDPLGGLDTAWAQGVRERLRLEREAAEADRIDWALASGRHQDLLPELTARDSAGHLDERAAGQLMLALYRAGRQADALQCYQRIRHRLVNELGADPGPALQELHGRILAADPALLLPRSRAATTVARIPRQLPRDLPTFVGREHELADLVALLEEDTAGVIVLHGGPGAGKSALATRAAHRAAARFPDGQLHVNLRGATPGVQPLSPVEALHQLLRALAVDGGDIPAGADEAAALLRTVVAGRRLLIVLDNAATAAQVRPLLAGCTLLVTSRIRLTALEGATHLRVGPLNPGEARLMLDVLLPAVKTSKEPEETGRLAELCGHLPLGLHVAAARLNARPSWAVRDLVDRLTDERHRLTELAAGDVALRSSLAVSHTALHDSDNPTDRRAAHALCLFGLLPTTEIDLDLAAAVLGVPPAEADRTVERLLDAHLVEETAPGRFHMHDLTRLFADELGAATIPPDEQTRALTRLLSHYVATARLANTLVYPHRTHHPAPDVATPPVPLASAEEALRWLDDQHHNMITTAQRACLGPVEHARLGVGLALALHWYQSSGSGDLPETLSLQENVVIAAERLGDRRSQAYAHGNLAGKLRHLNRLDEACEHSAAELAICREIGDRFGEQRALGNLGYTNLAQHLPEQAIDHLQRQLDLARDIDAPIGQAFALVNLGKAHHQLGRSEQAIELIEKGLAWYEKTGDHYRQCDAHEVLARIHIDLGQHDRAIALTTRGLDHARQIGYRYGEVWALTTLAQAHRLSGDTDEARHFAEQAVTASNNFHGTQARTDALTERALLA
jgi:DNA-binding SARP family transcriptional activator/tetratricopeptide (TPR) repeat protein